jgi:hypothetical protein
MGCPTSLYDAERLILALIRHLPPHRVSPDIRFALLPRNAAGSTAVTSFISTKEETHKSATLRY